MKELGRRIKFKECQAAEACAYKKAHKGQLKEAEVSLDDIPLRDTESEAEDATATKDANVSFERTTSKNVNFDMA